MPYIGAAGFLEKLSKAEYEQRWNRRAKPVDSSWRMDETYIQTRPKTGYLYRAVDK